MSLNDFDPSYISFEDGINALAGGSCDAAVVMAAPPTGAIVELAAKTGKWKMLPLAGVVLDELVSSSDYFLKRTVPAGTYGGLDEDYETIAASSVMMCRTDMEEEIVYKICKAVYDHLDDLATTVDSAKEMSVDTGWRVPADLHPGAAKFFREFGGMQ